ncbi:hypothetical protein PoB_004470600 [Plakobranchus ocellatus]|uniref:Uncharacterized protein n=1 Tax=Plakobranchus ocellatus TaxID=259542 RepID=A0AAV4BCR1_9GAST|nr:hypothetical protein PoB_004470600 [Plakobranchus ocellatus]
MQEKKSTSTKCHGKVYQIETASESSAEATTIVADVSPSAMCKRTSVTIAGMVSHAPLAATAATATPTVTL